MKSLEEKLSQVPKFDLTGFKFVKNLDEGAYGSPFLAQKGQEYIVVKKFILHREISNLDELIEREITNLSFCKHNQLVIGFKGISFTDLDQNQLEYPLLIQNYAKNGSLGSLLEKYKSNPELLNDTQKMIILYGTAKSMQYLHNFHIIHRDLKVDNILLDENNYPLICDFGSSRTIVNTSTKEITASGTPRYSAPEVFDDSVCENFSMESDVFSYGMVMYATLTGKKPYEDDLGAKTTFFTISNFLKSGRTLTLPKNIPSYFRQLISLCLKKNPQERPTFSDIIDLFDSGIILPEVINNQESLEKYFSYTKMISNSGKFDRQNLLQLKKKITDKDNNPKLAAVISFFLADYFNDKDAQAEIGSDYISGVIFKADPFTGFSYLQKAAEQNQREALFYLGQAYENGIGCEISEKTANIYFNRSAELGFEPSINYIRIKEEYKNVDKKHSPTVIIIGSQGSGKTTFINKIINIYNHSQVKSTIGTKDYYLPCIDDDNEKFYVKICDTQGMEEFGPLLPQFCRSASLALVMFDINRPKTFDDIDTWISQLRNVNQSAKLIIIANKIDLEWFVSEEKAREKAEEYEAKYIEVSALKGLNVDSASKKIAKNFRALRKLKKETAFEDPTPLTPSASDTPENKKCHCSI